MGGKVTGGGRATLRFAVDRHERDAFYETCSRSGTTPGDALRLFVSVFNVRGGRVFDPENPYGFNDETLAALRDVGCAGPFESAEDMLSALGR